MRTLRKLLTWGFTLQTFAVLMLGCQVAFRVPHNGHIYSHGRLLNIEIWLTFTFVTGVMSGLAAWRMKRADRFSRLTGISASTLNLLLFPIGTVLGVAGLVYFLRNGAAAAPAEKKHVPVPGDGTSKWSQGMAYAVQIVWFWFAYGYIRDRARRMGMPAFHWTIVDLLILEAAIYTATLFHELGHLLAGAAVNFHLVEFRLGFLHWYYRGGRWRFKRAGWLGGHTAMVPRSPHGIREGAMFMIFGGPIGSAFLCVIGYALLLAAGNSAWIERAGEFLVFVTAFGSADFIGNLMPLASGVQYSDGARLWQLYRRGPWADYLCATFYFGLSRTTAIRARDWPRAMVEHAANFSGSLPDDPGGTMMAYVHFEDCGEVERAAHYLERASAATPVGTERARVMAVERAYFEAYYHRDAAAGARWLAQAPEKPDSIDYLRSKAAVLAAQGDVAGAEHCCKRAWELASKLPPVGVYEGDRRQLRMILERLKERPVVEAVPA